MLNTATDLKERRVESASPPDCKKNIMISENKNSERKHKKLFPQI